MRTQAEIAEKMRLHEKARKEKAIKIRQQAKESAMQKCL